MKLFRFFSLIILTSIVILSLACSTQKVENPEKTAEKPQTEEPQQTFTVEEQEEGRIIAVDLKDSDSEDIHAILAAADKMDGNEDHKVHKCVGCSLNMDGDEAYSSTIDGYELHHCSAECRAHFLSDPAPNLVALQPKVAIQ